MKVRRTLHPSQPGTKALMEKYGNDLVCVRYRYDEKRNKKLTTVEIIVNEKKWIKNKKRIPANRIMLLRVEYGEFDITNLIRASGGRWNKELKLWELAYREVISLGLEDRIVTEGGKVWY